MEGRLDPIPTIASPAHPLADPNERVSFRVTGPLKEAPKTGIDWQAKHLGKVCFCLTRKTKQEQRVGRFALHFSSRRWNAAAVLSRRAQAARVWRNLPQCRSHGERRREKDRKKKKKFFFLTTLDDGSL